MTAHHGKKFGKPGISDEYIDRRQIKRWLQRGRPGLLRNTGSQDQSQCSILRVLQARERANEAIGQSHT
jgi:hypothetical protein